MELSDQDLAGVTGGQQGAGGLAGILDQISPPYRDVLQLHFVEGLSMDEVAERLGITRVAARRQLQVGREMANPLLGKP